MRWLENITGGYSSSAKVINGTLVLSLPDAKSPVVWRMELSDIKAAAFEIEDQGDKGYALVMKTPKGDPQHIAPFDEKGKALRALMAASEAMEHAQVSAANNDKAGGSTMAAVVPQKKSNPLVTGLVGIVVLVGLLFMLTQIGPRSPQSIVTSASMTGGQAGTDAAGRAGVPVSADDFLRER